VSHLTLLSLHNILDNSRIESLTTKVIIWKKKKRQREHLLEKLDEVDRDLQNLNHKRYELEQRQKYLLKRINELDGIVEEKDRYCS
jgi:hypothetical protein